ncbi:MAG: two pore domain potassium channel family protein, partial [Gemmatimonadales bacterium]|nr:two pore domain potassium channel family protein [Gemmatimonadales bacterium]
FELIEHLSPGSFEFAMETLPKEVGYKLGYFSLVTLTTVGYGDISPQTNLGQMVAAAIMMLGYAIIAIPTGIVTMELSRARGRMAVRRCVNCSEGGHDLDAAHCKWCGARL